MSNSAAAATLSATPLAISMYCHSLLWSFQGCSKRRWVCRLQRMASKERKKPEKSPLSGHHSKSPSIGSASARSLDLDREPSIGRVRSLEEQQRLGGRTPSDPVNAKRSSQVWSPERTGRCPYWPTRPQ